MSDLWKRLDAGTGRAASRIFGERVAVSPKLESEYAQPAPDPDRAAVEIRGIFGLEHDAEDLRGQRLRGEFAGVARVGIGAAHVLFTAAEYGSLGYELKRGDAVAFPEQDGAPVYSVVIAQPLDCGDRFVLLAKD